MSIKRCFFCGGKTKEASEIVKTGNVTTDFQNYLVHTKISNDLAECYEKSLILDRDGFYYIARDSIRYFCVTNGYYFGSIEKNFFNYIETKSAKLKFPIGNKIRFWGFNKKKIDNLRKQKLAMKK